MSFDKEPGYLVDVNSDIEDTSRNEKLVFENFFWRKRREERIRIENGKGILDWILE